MSLRAMPQNGVLTSDDLAFLQEVYEMAVAGISNVDDATMHEVVGTLIMYYRAGDRDKRRLAALAARDLHRAAG
jgi:hypothetical protein